MFRGRGRTSSVIQAAGAAGAPGASPGREWLVVLVKTNRPTPAATASSSSVRVPRTLVSTKACREWKSDMWLVQGRGVQHGLDAVQRAGEH